MSPSDLTHPKFGPTEPLSAAEIACVEALAAVRQELLAMPPAAVIQPAGDERTLAERVLARVADARRGDAVEEEVRLARLELLARALVRAELELAWAPTWTFVELYDALVARADHAFSDVETVARMLVRRGIVRRRELPRRVRCRRDASRDERCRYICELVEVLSEHEDEDLRGDVPLQLLWRAHRLACQLEGARPRAAGALSPRELRDRAYTALAAALRDDESRERSGVFIIEVVDGALASVRCA